MVRQVPVIVWLSYYAENTPGIEAMDSATTIIGWKSEPQPDGLLRILPEYGGRTWNEGGSVHGAPELVVEVAKATRYVDFGPKLDDYQRAGVTEYVVLAIEPDEICWYNLDQGTLVQQPIGDGGLYRSTVFPGLWLDPVGVFSGDTRRLRATVDMGCATREHAALSRGWRWLAEHQAGSLGQVVKRLPKGELPVCRLSSTYGPV